MRDIPEDDAPRFMTTQLLAGLGSFTAAICLLGNPGPYLTKEFVDAFVSIGMLFLIVATAVTFKRETTLPWKEWILFIVSCGIIADARAHGFASIWRDSNVLLATVALVVVFGWYVYYLVDRLVWEPLASAALFLGTVLVTALGRSWEGVIFMYSGAALLHFILWLTVGGSSYEYERGYRSIPFD